MILCSPSPGSRASDKTTCFTRGGRLEIAYQTNAMQIQRHKPSATRRFLSGWSRVGVCKQTMSMDAMQKATPSAARQTYAGYVLIYVTSW